MGKCACGCGEEVKPGNTFIRFHNRRGTTFKQKPERVRRGWHHSQESKQLIGASKEGVPRTAQTRKKLSESLKGRLAGEANPNWQGKGVKYRSPYLYVYAPKHPRATKGGGWTVPLHVLVAEKILGRFLLYTKHNHPDNEEVHHINFNPKDNRPQNLLVCTRGYHRFLHAKITKLRLVLYFRELVAA